MEENQLYHLHESYYVRHLTSLFVSLQVYARENDEHKRTLLLVNKADLLPYSVRLVVFSSISVVVDLLYVVYPPKTLSAGRNGRSISISMIFSSCFGRLRLLLQL